MAKVTFREERCKGCGLCVEVCPKKIVELNKHQLNSKGYHPAGVTDQEPVSYTHLYVYVPPAQQ